MDTINLPQNLLVALAYEARQIRLVHPRGHTDNGGRWYPDEVAEGGTPDVRSPSRAWPWSYMVACRTRRWCAQLPDSTLRADAGRMLAAIAEGRVTPSDRLAKLLAAAPVSPTAISA